MRIAVVKPDYGIIGGFEIVVNNLIDGLQSRGYNVDLVTIDATNSSHELFGLKLPPVVYSINKYFIDYISNLNRFHNLDLLQYDVVISTQPPSFSINHPKHISFFYHHQKIYYDLHDLMLQQSSGFFKKMTQVFTAKIVRMIDSKYLNKKIDFLAGSRHIKERLKKFNNLETNISVCYAGIDDSFLDFSGESSFKYPICIGRHEYPKRTELFIHAMKHIPAIQGYIIGKGGLTNNLQRIDSYLTYLHRIKKEEIEDSHLWKKMIFNIDLIDLNSIYSELDKKEVKTNITFRGEISTARLKEEYSKALCVVCPAYEEDFGLTAVEGMAFGKPIIACEDGGGYIELVDDEKTGFIVKPDAEEIAGVIEYLNENKDIAKKIGERGKRMSKKFTWENTLDIFEEHIKSITK
ncbi:MAG: glycosyltransferase family 4 protein [Candidatus Methanoperedens sp.]|nr:glycosyltransferase family 4 protein [Candidatus Methanoperedens sp.]